MLSSQVAPGSSKYACGRQYPGSRSFFDTELSHAPIFHSGEKRRTNPLLSWLLFAPG